MVGNRRLQPFATPLYPYGNISMFAGLVGEIRSNSNQNPVCKQKNTLNPVNGQILAD